MIISHKYKFIFIKTKKTAGTSLEVFLSQHCDEHDIVTPIHPPVPPHQPRHYTGSFNPIPETLQKLQAGKPLKTIAREFRDKTWKEFQEQKKFYNHIAAPVVKARLAPRLWQEYFKFCVERNPWDKTLSFYHMVNHNRGGNYSLDEYLADGNYCLNYPFYTDVRGEKILVDRVIKYETLTQELGEIFAMLGIPFDGSLGVKAKGDFRKDRRPYQDVYTDEQRRMVEKVFAKEIRMHDYYF